MKRYKVVGTEASLTTASAFNGAQIVRVYNNTASDVLLTIADSSAVTLGTITIKAGNEMLIRKTTTDTIAASAAVKAVAIGFDD